MEGRKKTRRCPDESHESEDSSDASMEDLTNEKIEVEFEARSPDDRDFHGIKRLLQQLFLKANIDLGAMTNLILQQNYVGSVIQQAEMSDGSDTDEDDDVFGLISVLNITEKKGIDCIQQLKNLLMVKCRTDAKAHKLKAILDDNENQVGFILNERFVNIPAQIAVPSFENLRKEVQLATQKKMKFNFTYYMLLSKLYKPVLSRSMRAAAAEDDFIYSNAEEELLIKEADLWFDFCVIEESDVALTGQWNGDSDDLMKPFRRLFLLKAEKLDKFIDEMKINFSST